MRDHHLQRQRRVAGSLGESHISTGGHVCWTQRRRRASLFKGQKVASHPAIAVPI